MDRMKIQKLIESLQTYAGRYGDEIEVMISTWGDESWEDVPVTRVVTDAEIADLTADTTSCLPKVLLL